jgi:hypothetical protein
MSEMFRWLGYATVAVALGMVLGLIAAVVREVRKQKKERK